MNTGIFPFHDALYLCSSLSGRLIMLLVFNFRLRSFEFSFWVLLLLSFTLQIFGPRDMEGLIKGGFDDPHLEKLIMFTC